MSRWAQSHHKAPHKRKAGGSESEKKKGEDAMMEAEVQVMQDEKTRNAGSLQKLELEPPERTQYAYLCRL